MTTTTSVLLDPHPEAVRSQLVRTARFTGLFYLGLAITGMLGFLLVRARLFVEDDPTATLANLQDHETLARVGLVLELGIVLTQVLCALWFFRLFRSVDSFAAGCIAVFGVINAVAILGSAAFLATALDVAGGAIAGAGSTAETVQLLYLVSGHLWGVGALFFGLWLIPMGRLARRSGWMPVALGWLLMIGGVGYVLSAFVTYAFPEAGAVVEAMTLPATVGEFWILGYLVVVGVRRSSVEA